MVSVMNYAREKTHNLLDAKPLDSPLESGPHTERLSPPGVILPEPLDRTEKCDIIKV